MWGWLFDLIPNVVNAKRVGIEPMSAVADMSLVLPLLNEIKKGNHF